jgi:hypothetical protein
MVMSSSQKGVKLSVFEIYDERINDLLNPKNTNLKLLEQTNHPASKVFIKNLTEHKVTTF